MKTLESSDPSLGLWPRLRRKLLAPETRLLLFWPVFELAFMALERLRPEDTQYFVMHCPLDDCIPFWEGAMVPYLFWFLYLGGTVAYTYFREVPAFRRMMAFIILTYGVTVLIYLLFPNCQDLRPAVFPRDNALTRFTAWFYVFDTNTDVSVRLSTWWGLSRRTSACGTAAVFRAGAGRLPVRWRQLPSVSLRCSSSSIPYGMCWPGRP